ncbi:MAG: hypothetical protein V4548_10825 [Bacteroidota bacterium]
MRKLEILGLFLISSLLLVSCKKENKATDENEAPKVEIKQNFNIQIVATAAKKDDFALYFTEDNTINFTAENTAWRGIKGGNIEDTVNFELTQDRMPSNIRLDFGLNKEQDSVTIKSVKVNFYQNSFEFKGSDFFTYFNKDENFKYKIDAKNGTLTLYKKNGEYKTPFFYPTQLNNDKVKEITTKK